MKCQNCGAEYNGNFCSNCGQAQQQQYPYGQPVYQQPATQNQPPVQYAYPPMPQQKPVKNKKAKYPTQYVTAKQLHTRSLVFIIIFTIITLIASIFNFLLGVASLVFFILIGGHLDIFASILNQLQILNDQNAAMLEWMQRHEDNSSSVNADNAQK